LDHRDHTRRGINHPGVQLGQFYRLWINVWESLLNWPASLFRDSFQKALDLLAPRSRESQGAQPLVLTGAIPLPNVQGRIDHFGYDPKGRLFVSARGNNSEEILDISAGTRVHAQCLVLRASSTITNCLPKFLRRSEPAPLGTGERRGRALTASTWEFRLVAAVARRY
jgi:hypothetical protein